MRIAFVVPGFAADEHDPGIPVVEDVLCRLREQAGIHVIALRHPEPASTYTVRGIRVTTLGGGVRAGPARAPLLAAAIRVLRAEHRREPFAAVHGLWGDEPGAVAVAASRLLRIPSVVSVMGGELVALPAIGYGGALSRLNRILTGYALRKADAVTAGCTGAVTALETMKGSRRERVHLVPWGANPAAFTAPAPPVELAGAFRILHVGSLVPVKGIDRVLRAAACARDSVPGLHVHLAGEGPDRRAILALAAQLGLEDSVTLHGHVPRAQLGSYYRAADVLIVGSHHEMQPATVLEAAWCSLPVVGMAVGLLPDWAPEAAMIVRPGDADGLAAGLVRMAQPAERARLGAAASSRVRAGYLAEHTASRLVSLYSALGSHVPQRSGKRVRRAAS
jgi:glycosyltransferase involved in cell wall biosynthesis